MNIFLHYQKEILNSLKTLEKEKLIIIPNKFKGLTVELPPKNTNAAISCNAALILAKYNNISSLDLAEILKKNLLKAFKEFKSVEVAGPGFLNINFTAGGLQNQKKPERSLHSDEYLCTSRSRARDGASNADQ